jgi:hypothetical protein
LTQSGATLSGTYHDQYAPYTTGPVNGHTSAPRGVTLTVDPACCNPFTLTGTVDDSFSTITGTVNGSGFVNDPWTLRR